MEIFKQLERAQPINKKQKTIQNGKQWSDHAYKYIDFQIVSTLLFLLLLIIHLRFSVS